MLVTIAGRRNCGKTETAIGLALQCMERPGFGLFVTDLGPQIDYVAHGLKERAVRPLVLQPDLPGLSFCRTRDSTVIVINRERLFRIQGYEFSWIIADADLGPADYMLISSCYKNPPRL